MTTVTMSLTLVFKLQSRPYTSAQSLTQLHSSNHVGATGCVLANKLSGDKNVTVSNPAATTPKSSNPKFPLFSKLFHTQHDWDYYTVETAPVGNPLLLLAPRQRSLAARLPSMPRCTTTAPNPTLTNGPRRTAATQPARAGATPI